MICPTPSPRDVRITVTATAVLVLCPGAPPESLCPEDALNRGASLAFECLAAIKARRLASPGRAFLPLMPCDPQAGLLLAGRLMNCACQVGILGGEPFVDEGTPALANLEPVVVLIEADLEKIGA